MFFLLGTPPRRAPAARYRIPDLTTRVSSRWRLATVPPVLVEDPAALLLREVVAGRPPAEDGGVTVLPQPPGPVAGILAFCGHHVVAADVDPGWVAAQLRPGDLSAPVSARFLDALAEEIDRDYDNLDMVLVAPSAAGPPPLELRPVAPDADHERVDRSLRFREDVRTWATEDGAGLLIVARGFAGRWETAFEVAPGARGRGLGRALAASARHLVPAGDPVFAQVAPGNVASLRAVLATGAYVPIGAEVMFAHPR
jgi:hypothetical protein